MLRKTLKDISNLLIIDYRRRLIFTNLNSKKITKNILKVQFFIILFILNVKLSERSI